MKLVRDSLLGISSAKNSRKTAFSVVFFVFSHFFIPEICHAYCENDPICLGILRAREAVDRSDCLIQAEQEKIGTLPRAEDPGFMGRFFCWQKPAPMEESQATKICKAVHAARETPPCSDLVGASPAETEELKGVCNSVLENSRSSSGEEPVVKVLSRFETEFEKSLDSALDIVTLWEKEGYPADEYDFFRDENLHDPEVDIPEPHLFREARVKAKVRPCCVPFNWNTAQYPKSIERHLLKIPLLPERDPYLSSYWRTIYGSEYKGWDAKADTDGLIKMAHAVFDSKELVLGRKEMLKKLEYRIPRQGKTELEEDYIARRAQLAIRPEFDAAQEWRRKSLDKENLSIEEKVHLPHMISYIGNGSFSRVYSTHPFIEAKFEGGEPNWSEPARLALLDSSSTQVIKLRVSFPLEKDLVASAEFARRDVVLAEVLDQLAKRTFFRATEESPLEPLVRAIPYDISLLAQGVLKQRFVRGETAFAISSLVHRALSDPDIKAKVGAERILIGNLQFKSVEDARMRLRALEDFCRVVHDKLYAFLDQNELNKSGGFLLGGESKSKVNVAIDYNLGSNFIWNSEERVFYAVDP